MMLMKVFIDKELFNYQKHDFSFVRKKAYHIIFI